MGSKKDSKQNPLTNSYTKYEIKISFILSRKEEEEEKTTLF
jgi:hypothetical protein